MVVGSGESHTEYRLIFILFFSFSEPFVESIPQVHILLVILMASLGGPGKSSNYNNGVFDPRSGLFLPTFLTSIFSATFGMSKFLKVGPCPIVPRTSYGLVFMLSFLSIICGLAGKGMLLAIAVDIESSPDSESYDRNVGMAIWICTCVLLPMIIVSTYLSNT